jgi:hypothetical protein
VRDINKIRKLSLWIFIAPVVIINLCLFISVNYHFLEGTIFTVDAIGKSGFTIPYIDGGLSISRASRTYPTFLLFKPGMIITSLLLIKYWIANNNLIKEITNNGNGNNKFLIFGVLSAVFLIIHSIFLGVSFEHDLYKFFRRFMLVGFIIFELIAQGMLIYKLIKIRNKIENYINGFVLKLKTALVSLLVIVALVSIPILVTTNYTHFKHALEWNYFIGVVSFYLLTFFFWKKSV